MIDQGDNLYSCEGLNMAKEAKETPTKADIMREALAGGVSETSAIVAYAKERYGVEMTTSGVSQFKSNQKTNQKKAGGESESQTSKAERPATVPLNGSEPTLFKETKANYGNGLSRDDMTTLAKLINKVGVEPIRQVLDIAEFLK